MNWRSPSGFTLVELAVVLAIAGIMLAMIPAARNYAPMLEMDRAARGLAQELREARSDAVRYGNDVIVTFDVAAGAISVYNDQDRDGPQLADLLRRRTLAELSGGEVVFAAVATTGTDGAAIAQAVKMGSTSDPIAVTFRANGSAVNPGAIYLAHATEPRVELGRAIEILSTGKVDTWRYSVSGSPGPWMKWI